ncbi:MAG: hypothetical protein U5L07_16605 [Desulfobacterales bacterium]|nr:hypothetical protein [Desulfobacterales bacterium]
MAFAILLFHVLLLAAIGLLILIFRGIVNYLVWILLGGGLLAGAGLFLLYRYIQKEKTMVAKLLELPELKDRRVEVNILGGLASFKIDNQNSDTHWPAIEQESPSSVYQLDDPERMRVRELSELARLLEKNLISFEEYDRAKNALMKDAPPRQ